MKPSQINKLIEQKGRDNVIFFDGRNNYESRIGKFKNAVTPDVNHARDFPNELTKAKYAKLKNMTVITYCTGGIRCEVLTTLMKQSGFKDVYQIDGGIVKYGEKYQDRGLWQGKLFVFDGRLSTQFSNQAKDIASCSDCHSKTSHYINCATKTCNKLILLCPSCCLKGQKYCHDCAVVTAV